MVADLSKADRLRQTVGMAIWSRFIDTAMMGLRDFVLCYADDVLIYTKHESVDRHIEDLEAVFKRFEQYGIKIKASTETGINPNAISGSDHNPRWNQAEPRENGGN